jgi:hypothetical protein
MNLSELQPTFNLEANQHSHLYRWLLEIFGQYISPRILTIAKSPEEITDLLIAMNIPFHLGHIESIVPSFKLKYQHNDLVRTVKQMNLKNVDLMEFNTNMIGKFQTVIYIECIEKKLELKSCLRNIELLLCSRGEALITLPAFSTIISPGCLDYMDLKIIDYNSLKPFLPEFEILKLRRFCAAYPKIDSSELRQMEYIATVIRKRA